MSGTVLRGSRRLRRRAPDVPDQEKSLPEVERNSPQDVKGSGGLNPSSVSSDKPWRFEIPSTWRFHFLQDMGSHWPHLVEMGILVS